MHNCKLRRADVAPVVLGITRPVMHHPNTIHVHVFTARAQLLLFNNSTRDISAVGAQSVLLANFVLCMRINLYFLNSD